MLIADIHHDTLLVISPIRRPNECDKLFNFPNSNTEVLLSVIQNDCFHSNFAPIRVTVQTTLPSSAMRPVAPKILRYEVKNRDFFSLKAYKRLSVSFLIEIF